jgi:hypothetical protein
MVRLGRMEWNVLGRAGEIRTRDPLTPRSARIGLRFSSERGCSSRPASCAASRDGQSRALGPDWT